MSSADWTPLLSALDAWQADGRVARFWLRDDDAVEPTPALSRLLEIGRRHDVPLALAVIPAHAGATLQQALAGCADVDVALHGWSHDNHARSGQKKQELGDHRPQDVVLEELALGFERLRSLFADQFVPVLVPPWNRIDKALLPSLEGIGVRALSVFGPEKPGRPPMINTHADIMDWHGTRGCRPMSDIVTDVVKRLDVMRVKSDTQTQTMGLLTHHLVHDEAAWRFIEAIFEVTASHPACRWCGLPELLADL